MIEPFLELFYLLLGILIGGIGAWLIAKYKFSAASGSIPLDEVSERYILKEIFESLQNQADLYRDDLLDKEQEIRSLSADLSAKKTNIANFQEQLKFQKGEMFQVQTHLRNEFENLANRLLEEKSQKFASQNQESLTTILAPLKEKIKSFEDGVEKRFLEETKDRVSLKKEIEQLRALNNQLSKDAVNLTNALRGDNKSQGDWGEFRLEMVLEKAGLTSGIHFQTQTSYRDQDGRQKRPDFIINLPKEKHLVIDSKVSLTAYERFYSATNQEEKDQYLKEHLASVRRHLKDLSNKNYQQLYQINSPDYLLMFIPLDAAFTTATQYDPGLFNEALDKNIVIVTTSTLLATMRTVSFIWKQEKQKSSVLEIARQSGMLYDKFVGFVTDLQLIGTRLDSVQTSYYNAMNKLSDSKKYGDTLIGRAEKIKELGAKTSKSLPKELLDR